jgi:hypothetical protein
MCSWENDVSQINQENQTAKNRKRSGAGEASWGFEELIGPPLGADAISQGLFGKESADEAKDDSGQRTQ